MRRALLLATAVLCATVACVPPAPPPTMTVTAGYAERPGPILPGQQIVIDFAGLDPARSIVVTRDGQPTTCAGCPVTSEPDGTLRLILLPDPVLVAGTTVVIAARYDGDLLPFAIETRAVVAAPLITDFYSDPGTLWGQPSDGQLRADPGDPEACPWVYIYARPSGALVTQGSINLGIGLPDGTFQRDLFQNIALTPPDGTTAVFAECHLSPWAFDAPVSVGSDFAYPYAVSPSYWPTINDIKAGRPAVVPLSRI